MIEIPDLVPNACYWARRKNAAAEEIEAEIVQVSTVFGSTSDFFSVAVLGSDQHFSLKDFEFLFEIEPFTVSQMANSQ